jgi:hypothetical protein
MIKQTSNDIYLQGQFITLHKDPNWVSHKLASHLQDLMRKGSRDQTNLVYRKAIYNEIDIKAQLQAKAVISNKELKTSQE